MRIASSDLALLRTLYGQGLYLQAFAEAQRFGPFAEWEGVAAQLLAGRLVMQLGAPKLSRRLHLKAYRDTPTYHEAIYYHARHRLERFGPWSAWKYLTSMPDDWNEAPPEIRADWYGLHAYVSGRLRDFERAERWLAKARAVGQDRAWLNVEEAATLEFAERYDEALASVQKALVIQPYFRPAVQAEAHLLQLLGRDDEAIERLTEAVEHLESGIVVLNLAGLLLERKRYAEAGAAYERYVALSPLLEPDLRKWLDARRADIAYFQGDSARAAGFAREAGDDYYRGFAERLEGLTGPPTTPLAIDFPKIPREPKIEPALAMLRFWNLPANEKSGDFLRPDGLPDPGERLWVEKQGLTAAEFTVTTASIEALLAAGLPFQMQFTDGGFAHVPIVVGYDAIRGTIRFREMYDYRSTEAPIEPILKRYAGVGPRGIVLVPHALAERLNAIDLPDRAAYDQLHRVQSALAADDRPTAAAAYEAFLVEHPDHRLTLAARLALARYDQHPTAILEALRPLVERYPNESAYLHAYVNALRDMGRTIERMRFLDAQLERPDGDPIFGQHLAQAALLDPCLQAQGMRALNRTIRRRPASASAYYLLGHLLWESRKLEPALDAYRFAACLDETEGTFSEAYFRAAKVLRRTKEAMRFLQDRFDRAPDSVAATRALFHARSEQEDMAGAFDLIRTARVEADAKASSERGELAFFAAEMHAAYEAPGPSAEALADAEPLVPRPAWLRMAARLAVQRCDSVSARTYLTELLALEPTAVDALRNLSRVREDLEGRPAVVAWLRERSRVLTHFRPLLTFLIELLRNEEPSNRTAPTPAEPILRRLVEQCPTDPSAIGELAVHLSGFGRVDEALELLDKSPADADDPTFLVAKARVLTRADRPEDAADAYAAALETNLDNDSAIIEWVALGRSEADKTETLEALAEEFRTHTGFGDGLFTFREQAAITLDADDALALCQGILDERPEIWQCWSVGIEMYIRAGRREEAVELGKDAVARFPLSARLWSDLSDAYEAMEDNTERIEALKKAYEAAPSWSYAARELAEALETEERREEASVILEQAVARGPLDPINHLYLADTLWNLELADRALVHLKRGLLLDPGLDGAWRMLSDWADRLERPELVTEYARACTANRPGDARGWLWLVRSLQGPDSNDEALAALDRAIALSPRLIEAYDLKAERLSEMERYDEALAAALPAVFAEDQPLILQGRAAWIEARRGRLDEACNQMRALVTLEPTYSWAWQQLADWYNVRGLTQEFLEAASRFAELRPDFPSSLTMRAEARLQTGDRDGGKEDLREVQRNVPAYLPAGLMLFDAYLLDEEYRPARGVLAVLQEHASGGAAPLVMLRQVQLAARTGEQEIALDALCELLTFEGELHFGLVGVAMQECRKAFGPLPVEQLLRRTLAESEHFHPHTFLLWLDTTDAREGPLDERLKVVDRVLRLHPRAVTPTDVKAAWLAEAGRTDEALALCESPLWDGHPPLLLQARAAWIWNQRGDQDTAIERMRAIVEAEPDFVPGWRYLAEWYDPRDEPEEFREATEQLVRIDSTGGEAYRLRGIARRWQGDRRGAAEDFRQAFDIDPTDALAGLNLLDEQLADRDAEGARKTLARVQEHAAAAVLHLRAVQLAMLDRDRDAARQAFAALCREPDASYLLLHQCAEELREAGWATLIDETLAEVLPDPAAHPAVGRLWAQASARHDGLFEEKLPELLERGEIGREALFATLQALALPKTVDRLEAIIAKHETILRADPVAWARTGEALANVRRFEVAAGWLADWRERVVPDPWMFAVAVIVFRQSDRVAEASAVSRKALELGRDDPTLALHHTYLALEEALAGRGVEAFSHFEKMDEADVEGDVPMLFFRMARALVRVQLAPDAEKSAAFATAKLEMTAALEDLAPGTPDADLTRTYPRWAKALAAAEGGIWSWIWSLKTRWSPPV